MKLISLLEVFRDMGDAPESDDDLEVSFKIGPASWRAGFQGRNFGVWTDASHQGFDQQETQRQIIQGFKQVTAWLVKAMQEGRTPEKFYFIPASDSRLKLFSRIVDRISGSLPGWEFEPFESGLGNGFTVTKVATETVGSNAGEQGSEDEKPRPDPRGDEEGNATWDWTDPYHSSGNTNAVLSNTP